MFTLCSFSRHGITQASLVLLIWLSKMFEKNSLDSSDSWFFISHRSHRFSQIFIRAIRVIRVQKILILVVNDSRVNDSLVPAFRSASGAWWPACRRAGRVILRFGGGICNLTGFFLKLNWIFLKPNWAAFSASSGAPR